MAYENGNSSMSDLKSNFTLIVASLCSGQIGAQAPAATADDGSLEAVLITAQREARTSKGATGLDLSLTDTPQSVSVIDRETLDNFGLDEINDVLRFTTGVNVESVETDRTYYNARGFDILSMQVDGVGMPFDELVTGALDSAAYDKIEVVRGANGLLTGAGNPSGTVNYVRKRPTNDAMASIELTLGSWNRKRLDVDVSMPLTTSEKWAMRAVVAGESKDSWLDLYKHERKLFYGIVDGQLGDRTTVAFGYARQESDSDGVLWGALPLLYSDGTQANFDVATTTSMQWTYWNTHADNAFAEFAVQLPHDWQLRTVLTYNQTKTPSELFWTYPSYLDRDTGLGLYGSPSKFNQNAHTALSDTYLSGKFQLWGQTHEATLGLSVSKARSRYYEYPILDPADYTMPAFPGWTGNEVARPTWGAPELQARSDTRFDRLYGAARFSVSDAIKLIAGFNGVDTRTDGFSWGTPANKREHAVSPYLGATWRVVSNLNAYASYSDIYQPQSVVDANLQPLGAAKGKSYEAGLKAEWFDKQLLTSLALFKAEQDNLQQFAGYAGDNFTIAYYEGIAVRSKGYELEVAGHVFDSLKLQSGYTHLSLNDPQGAPTRTFIPRDTFKLLATWHVPRFNGLEVGTSVRWQDRIYLDTGFGVIRQGAYAVYGVQASYAFNDRFELNANVNNLADKKYLTSLQWDQAFYGEPRSFNASMRWKY